MSISTQLKAIAPLRRSVQLLVNLKDLNLQESPGRFVWNEAHDPRTESFYDLTVEEVRFYMHTPSIVSSFTPSAPTAHVPPPPSPPTHLSHCLHAVRQETTDKANAASYARVRP